MPTLSRSLGIAVAAAGCAATLALGTSAPTLAANKALMVNGIAAGNLTDIAMANILGGMFGGKTYERENIPWPQQSRPVTGLDSMSLTDSVAQGVVNLDASLTEALAQLEPGEHVTIVGLSAGSLVVNDEVRKLANDPNAPDKSQLKIVVIADSSRILFNRNRYDAIIDYQYRVPAETKYDTIVVAAEYDGFADFPDRWWNFLAVANAFAGSIVRHVPTMLTDLSTVPAENITVTTNSLGGVTTSYLIPAKVLPLVVLLPFLAPQEEQLRATIESAYARNDNKGTAADQVTDAVQVADEVTIEEPTDAPAVIEADLPDAVTEPVTGTVADDKPVTAPTTEDVTEDVTDDVTEDVTQDNAVEEDLAGDEAGASDQAFADAVDGAVADFNSLAEQFAKDVAEQLSKGVAEAVADVEAAVGGAAGSTPAPAATSTDASDGQDSAPRRSASTREAVDSDE